LEFEICKLLHVTPKQLGTLRYEDPVGISFLERSLVYRWKQRVDQQKEIERKSKRGRRR